MWILAGLLMLAVEYGNFILIIMIQIGNKGKIYIIIHLVYILWQHLQIISYMYNNNIAMEIICDYGARHIFLNIMLFLLIIFVSILWFILLFSISR